MKKIMIGLMVVMFLLVSITAGTLISKSITLSSVEKDILDTKIDTSNIKIGKCIVRDDKYCTSIVTKGNRINTTNLFGDIIEIEPKLIFTIKINYLKCIRETSTEESFATSKECLEYMEKISKEIEDEILIEVESKLKVMSKPDVNKVTETKTDEMEVNVVASGIGEVSK